MGKRADVPLGLLLKPEGFRQRIVSLISKTAISLWSEFLASLPGHVRRIEAHGDLFLSHPQTQNRPSRVHKRSQLFIRTHVFGRPLREQTHRELVYRPLQFQERS